MAKQIIDAYKSGGYINLKYDDGTSGVYSGMGSSVLYDFGPDFLLIGEYHGVRISSPDNETLGSIDVMQVDEARVVGRKIVVRSGNLIYTYDFRGNKLSTDTRF
jgi:hypothetical protein